MSKLKCAECNKDVSTEIPSNTIVRAVVMCPECYAAENDIEL